MTDDTVSMDDVPGKEYQTLSSVFFRGELPGQIRSVYKTREENPGKVADFRKAIEDGKINLSAEVLTTELLRKLEVIGINVPQEIQDVVALRPRGRRG